MASYQDLESRLGVIERKIEFVMKSFTVTKLVPSTILGPDGQPGVAPITLSLLDLYTAASNLGLSPAEIQRVGEEVV